MRMKQWDTLEAVERAPDTLSGAWVFRNTRVSVAALFESLLDGATTYSREQGAALALLTEPETVIYLYE
jgi:hypothetical protein